MPAAPFPETEAIRLATLRKYDILDSAPEPAFDAISEYIARQFDAEISVISLVDTDRQWFKATCGLDASETHRDHAFCAYTILDRKVNYIPDARQDPRVIDNPLVTGAPFIRFYCGAPLIAPNGQVVGSLCVIDSNPRPDFPAQDQALLQRMADVVIEQMEMRKAAKALIREVETRKRAELSARDSRDTLQHFVDHVPISIALIGRDGTYHMRSNRYLELETVLFPEAVRDNFITSISARPDWLAAFDAVLKGKVAKREADRFDMINGDVEYAKWEIKPWFAPDDTIRGAVLSVTMVTDQVEARLETERQNELFEAVLENIEDGIVACDADGHLTLFNRKTRQMHGIDAIELPIEECGEYYSLYEEDGVTPLLPERVPLFRALKGETVAGQPMVIDPDNLPKRDIVAQARQLRHADGSVMGAVASMADVTATKLANRKFRESEARAVHVAYHDSLTGLANRAQFNERFGSKDPIEAGKIQTALFIDLNRFKLINDTLGHAVGDDLLIRVSEILQDVVTDSSAFISRFGGDEFVIVCDVTGSREAMDLAMQLADRLNTPIAIEGNTVVTGAAIGVALAPDHGNTVARLVRRADIAMYRAKADNVRKPVLFEPAFELDRVRRTLMETELKKSIAQNQLDVLFQPIVCGQSRDMIGVEALARWNHPWLGSIEPEQFIPIAEECGFIVELGDWVLSRAMEQFAGQTDMFLSINLSPMQFRDPDLVTKILSCLARTGVNPSQLELEVTENLLINDSAVAQKVIARLKQEGIRIALDDFGTGYSSLSYIQTIPFDKVKIDKSFIMQLGDHVESEAVVRCVVQLASALGMIVTAEGVETDQHETLLDEIGCQTLQGYKYGHPMAFAELLDMFGRSGSPQNALLAG